VLFVNILCFFLDTWDGSVGKIEGCETVFLTFYFWPPRESPREREERERREFVRYYLVKLVRLLVGGNLPRPETPRERRECRRESARGRARMRRPGVGVGG